MFVADNFVEGGGTAALVAIAMAAQKVVELVLGDPSFRSRLKVLLELLFGPRLKKEEAMMSTR